ncbi:RNA polymerase sigma-70 factor [Phocaeicola plebeius]|jgi:RNA polymerase sigma-70 factor|uniref:RNA polymerase sigma-70 factor n=1 Tax=Phocaeicola plebeius TaxID=310297 RepID=UPI0026EAF664|nr:RNA polymerase sigma-70 factor [Phocaeicola plebeius]
MIDIIRQVKQGNSKAFKTIFDRYWNIVYRFTGLYLMDNYEKEEITQQVFIKLWEKRELLDEEKDLDGLLFIITRNLIFNHIRKSINEEKLAETLQLASEASSEIEQGIEAEDLRKYIEKLVQMLPERQRTAFILSKKKGLKVKEIAEEMHISEKGAARNLYLATKFLKKHILFFWLAYSVFSHSCYSFQALEEISLNPWGAFPECRLKNLLNEA